MASKKSSIIAFSTSSKTQSILNSLQRESGKNRSQVIRDLLTSAANKPVSTSKYALPSIHTDIHSEEYIIKSFFELLSKSDITIISQAIISRGDRVLAVLPKKIGTVFKYSTWEFPSIVCKSFDFPSELSQKLKKELGITPRIEQLISGRLIPDRTIKGNPVISLLYHCRIVSGKISPSAVVKEIKWIPSDQLGRYFTTSLGDHLIAWLTQLK